VSSLNFPVALLDPSLSTTVTGTFIDTTGAPVTSGQVRFELKPSIATVIQNQNVVEPSIVIGSITSAGLLMNQAGTGPMVVVRNTVIEPGGTYYEVSIWPEFIKTAVFNWFATSATQDLSATVPLPPVLPFIPVTGIGVLRIFTMTAGGSYTPTPAVRALYVECTGGGGGGGGARATSSNASVAGGGTGGGYSASWITPVATSYIVTVGAGGLGAAAAVGGNPGNAGAATIFGSNLVVAPGGLGGLAGTVAGTTGALGNLTGPAAGTGDIALPGGGASGSVVLSASSLIGYSGGASSGPFVVPSPMGAISSASFQFNPNPAVGFGQGGSGGFNTGTQATGTTGGAGAPGIIRIWEFA
jgi:hypothetical protein